MNPFSSIYTEALIRPLFNLLVGVTNVLPTHNIGVAIIVVTLLVRLILLPPSLHQARQASHNQTKMNAIQKKLQTIKNTHKNDKAKQAEATMQAYREAGINPAAGCLPLLIQLPILIALYHVFLGGIGPDTFPYLYGFISPPQAIKTIFFGISLTEPSLLLGIIAGLSQFILMKYASPPPPPAAPTSSEETAQMMQSMQRNMMYFFPVMTVFIALQLPAALALYWVASTIFALIQQYFIKKVLKISASLPAV